MSSKSNEIPPTQQYLNTTNASNTKNNDKSTATALASSLSSHIRDKVILTTGISPNSLGSSFLTAIAAHSPRLLILASRSPSKARATAESLYSQYPSIKTRILELDLSSQKQIRKAAEEVKGYEEAIDVLVNNAGVMATPYAETEEGIELQFGTNHVGHFLFTNLIVPKLVEAGKGARVVNVSSDGYRLDAVRFEDLGFDGGKSYNKWRAYGQSKTANMLFSVSLARKLGKKGIFSYSLHPGAIQTNLGRHTNEQEFAELVKLDTEQGAYQAKWKDFPWKNLDEGAATHVVAAFDPSIEEHNGGFLLDARILPPEYVRSWGRDPIEAERLWKVSEELVGETFSYA